jgi:hypothetical protein
LRKKFEFVHSARPQPRDLLLQHAPDWPEDASDCAWGLGMSRPVQTPVESVRKWHSLAERRRRHFVELYRSERWKRYYTEEEFRSHMREVIANVEIWEQVLHRATGVPASRG